MIEKGHKVKIKDLLESEKYYCSVLGWDETMLKYAGKVFQIYDVCKFEGIDSVAILDEDYQVWYFFPEDVENLTDYSKNSFDFIVKSLT